jgi:Tol biopolymer transport system component/predicted Ser/Thr protein kinase
VIIINSRTETGWKSNFHSSIAQGAGHILAKLGAQTYRATLRNVQRGLRCLRTCSSFQLAIAAIEYCMTMPLAAGDRLGPYQIVAPIGAGGMGEVYKARDTRLDRTVAIKVSQEQFSDRFEREARAVAALNHPHICQLYDVGSNYLVMEFVEGAALEGPLSLDKAIGYAGQILDALDAAHRKGITHRDLKPANILVTRQGIKLLDFGLAKHSAPLMEADTTLAALTVKGQILGTLQYMAPEQLQGREADERSDLFSFGCVLYEMLSGKRAFEGQSAASVIAAILEREPAPLDATPALARVIATCLKKDPEQRFQNALDLRRALVWAIEEQGRAGTPNRSILWTWLPAAAALVLGALVSWTILQVRRPPAEGSALRLQIEAPEGGHFLVRRGPGNPGGLALSPDGKAAAYVATVNGKTGLWLRPLDATGARFLYGTEDAASPFWSPDGQSIAFSAGGRLLRVDLAGGAPVVIANQAALGGSWDNSGHILAGQVGSGLVRIPASGGTSVAVTTLDASLGESSHRWPQLLPGGNFLYWVQASGSRENSGVYAASLAKPAERVKLRLPPDSNAIYAAGANGKGYLLWLRGGTLVAQEFDPESLRLAGEPHPIADSIGGGYPLGLMDVAASGEMLLYGSFGAILTQLTWVDRTGKRIGVLGEPVEHVSTFRLSPDRRLVAETRRQSGIWLVETERGVSSRLTGISQEIYPTWSPDSRTVLFTRFGFNGLISKRANGVGEEQTVIIRRPVERANLLPTLTDWSGDRRWVLYHERTAQSQQTLEDIWVLPMTPEGQLPEGAVPKPYVRTPFSDRWARFSPGTDPRWVVYTSNESGRDEIYIDTFPAPRGKIRISTAGGTQPQWGEGGRELFYVSPDEKLMAVDLNVGAGSVAPSAPRELFPLPVRSVGIVGRFEADRDGRRFLVLTGKEPASQLLTVIAEWPALLKKGSPAP